jgi:hypothetical protein
MDTSVVTRPSFNVIPFSEFSPAACAVAAERGEAAIRTLETWGLSRKLDARLRQAVGVLHEVAKRSSYGSTEHELRATVEALSLVIDFFQISNCLGDPSSESVAHELALAIDGSLVGTSSRRQSREYQAQYWFGMLLTHAGFNARVPPVSTQSRHPDFVISLNGLDCAVEVKRPESFRSARDAMDRSAGQLRAYGKPGIIAMDLTDCLGGDMLMTGALQSQVPIDQLVRPHFTGRSEALGRRPKTYNQSDKYKRIISAVIFARLIGWRAADMSEPESSVLLDIYDYPAACEGLLPGYAAAFRRRIFAAAEATLGHAVNYDFGDKSGST